MSQSQDSSQEQNPGAQKLPVVLLLLVGFLFGFVVSFLAKDAVVQAMRKQSMKNVEATSVSPGGGLIEETEIIETVVVTDPVEGEAVEGEKTTTEDEEVKKEEDTPAPTPAEPAPAE